MKINGINAETQRTQSNAKANFSLRPSAVGAQRSARPTPQPLVSRHVSRVTCHPQRGVALIITLILLSVVTFMAVTFLALSRRERSAVATVTDTAGARYAADAALANAEAQVIANVLSTTNPYNFSLLVSTNYINPLGFQSGVSSPTNVNYQYSNGVPISGNDFLQNLTNLYYSPRPPVFIPTNAAGGNDFRFYLDLNRNRQFDTNGFVAETNFLGQSVTNFEVGDPEWIGVLERPDAPHGPNNKFVARYAFIALPIGNTLDLNAIYNQAMTKTVNPDPVTYGSDGFLRNQGVGSWEINLAAFLTDLDPNQWNTIPDPYNYREWMQPNQPNIGRGFEDALSLLSYRYGYNYNSLANANALFVNASLVFPHDNIDGYSDGSLQTTLNTNADWVADDPSKPWAGADNTNHFFTHQELFNPNEISPLFVNSLLAAGTINSNYEHYTFYRLLSQLGTDSTPESGKMNLNYDNLDLFITNVAGVSITNAPASTNFMAWTPIAFFTNAADRLLRAYTTRWRNNNPTNFATTFYSVTDFNSITNTSQWTNYPAFGITNIPVWVSNRFVYSPAVNRLLQLAANMYDATTNNTFALGKNYPSVFRPLFSRNAGGFGTNLFITGYTNVVSVNIADPNEHQLDPPIEALALATTNTGIVVSNWAVNVYGVPWIIGARKGFPNFNKSSLESVVGITRRLQVRRNNLNGSQPSDNTFFTNQMYTMNVSNYLGVEFWNSYASGYTGTVQILTRDFLSMWLTNDSNLSWGSNFVSASWINQAGATWTWTGYGASIAAPAANSFIIPLYTNATLLPDSIYRFIPSPPRFDIVNTNLIYAAYESNLMSAVGSQFPFPQFTLLTTNRLQAFMLEGTKIIDYVQFQQVNHRDLNAEIFTDDDQGVWNTTTNGALGIPQGIINQINISRNLSTLQIGEDGNWKPDPEAEQQSGSAGTSAGAIAKQQAFFDAFFKPNNRTTTPVSATNLLLSVQVPYSPTRYVVQYTFMQANDPLVHYLASDLNLLNKTNQLNPPSSVLYLTNLDSSLNGYGLRQLNRYYRPWGGNPKWTSTGDSNQWNFALKDSLVQTSDNWDFPTNKFPGVGWLGRVHRGTPWQTVYLKASLVGLTNWMNWTGNTSGYDANNSAPAQDRLLFNLFTTAFNDNATRGTLSVNVEAGLTNNIAAGLAAWSALFSGIVVPPVSSTNTYSFISPVGGVALANSPLGILVTNINYTRAHFTNADGTVGIFEHVGDIFAVPALTEKSPFLNLVNTNYNSDEMYEWLPQQTMSLLRCSGSPRYVIYCYGQALKPAPNAIYTGSGPFFGMVTNYQVVSEIATRSVVRFGSSITNVVTFNTNNIVVNGVNSNITNWFTVPVVTNNNAVIESFNILPPD
jgi:hypothetical protein